MTVKIRVRDYQSIDDAEIEVSGLTVITGANNTGKSAMLRAVYGAFTNARGTKYVRHGRDQCSVTVTFSDGRSVTWEKGEKVNRYTVDGKVLDKVGAGVPVELESLGVVPITASGRELWPQFAHQFTGQVFLLDQPGSVLAESIADVSRVGVLNEALRNTQGDKRALSSELKVRLADVARYETQEASYAGLDAVDVLAQEAEALKSLRDTLSTDLLAAVSLRDDLIFHVSISLHLASVRALPVPDEAIAAREIHATLTPLRSLATELSEAVRSLAALSPVSSVTLPDEGSSARAMKASEALTLVTGIREQMLPLRSLVGDADGIRSSVSLPLPDPHRSADQTKQLESYRSLRTELSSRAVSLDALRKELVRASEDLDAASHEVRDILGDAGNCPICGRC